GAAVPLEHHKVKKSPERPEHTTEYRKMGGRGGGPGKTMVERHYREHRTDDQEADGCGDFLNRRFFDGRAHAQPAREERLVIKSHVNRDERSRDHKRQKECPSLPVTERPRGNEDGGEEYHGARQRPPTGPNVRVAHG